MQKGFGCDYLKLKGGQAYDCENCMLPRFDPGPDLRAAYAIATHIFSVPGRLEEWRLQRFLESDPDEQMVEDVFAFREELLACQPQRT